MTSTDDAIVSRKTTKVLSDSDLPVCDIRGTVDELIALAGWAPFHRPSNAIHQREQAGQSGLVPWRMVGLDAAACRALRRSLPTENAGKLPAMLAAADALIQVTWLPNPPSESFQATDELPFEPTLANMEHIAAASAAIQNLLLAATARGIDNYWSSGGVWLRSAEVFEQLQIPSDEILLGAIFLFPRNVEQTQVVGSKLREQRPAVHEWFRWWDGGQRLDDSGGNQADVAVSGGNS